MVHAKKIISPDNLLFLIFVIFPFGQLFKLGKLSLIDIVVVLFTLVTYKKYKFKIPQIFLSLFVVLLFGLVVGSLVFNLNIVSGLLYFLRLAFYLLFFLAAKKYMEKNKQSKNLVIKSTLTSLIFVAVFGWIQYFIYPNFRPFTIFNWDDHIFRLTGAFLDPGFTSIFLVFGAIICFYLLRKEKNYLYLLGLIFFLVSLGFTYSRAGFISLIAIVLLLIFKSKRAFVYFVILDLFVFAFLALLPRRPGEATNLFRTYSIEERLKSFQSGLNIFAKSPVFGIGYNNLCSYKQKEFNVNPQSHSCGGLDNSLALILSTTGIVGLFVFTNLVVYLIKQGKGKGIYKDIFITSAIALLVHSQFNNSIFYPWVLIIIGILFALT